MFPELESAAAAAIELPLPPFGFAADAEAPSVEGPTSPLSEHVVEFPTDLPLTDQWFASAGLNLGAPRPLADAPGAGLDRVPPEPASKLSYELGSRNPYAQQSPAEPGVGYRLPLIGSQSHDAHAGLAGGGNTARYPLLMTPPILLVAFDDRQQQIESELEAFAERMNAMFKSHADEAVDYLRWCLYTEDRAIYCG